MIRNPAVAGMFYPALPAVLRSDLLELTEGRTPPSSPRGLALLVPHAGYIYSGRVAAATYTSVALSDRVVILGPNHTGRGRPIALFDRGVWRSPLGDVPVDPTMAEAILVRCGSAEVDEAAHRSEHSLEVQVPFLQFLCGRMSFVPVCIGTLHLPVLLDLGRAVAGAIRECGGDVLVVISSDMSHYVPAEVAEREDRKAIDRILALDPEGLHRVVLAEQIGMCGIAPAVVGLAAVRELGARAARVIAYATSADRTGDRGSVVGYAGVAVT